MVTAMKITEIPYGNLPQWQEVYKTGLCTISSQSFPDWIIRVRTDEVYDERSFIVYVAVPKNPFMAFTVDERWSMVAGFGNLSEAQEFVADIAKRHG